MKRLIEQWGWVIFPYLPACIAAEALWPASFPGGWWGWGISWAGAWIIGGCGAGSFLLWRWAWFLARAKKSHA